MKDRTDHSAPAAGPRADAILREGLRLLALGRQDEAAANIGRAAQLCAGADAPPPPTQAESSASPMPPKTARRPKLCPPSVFAIAEPILRLL